MKKLLTCVAFVVFSVVLNVSLIFTIGGASAGPPPQPEPVVALNGDFDCNGTLALSDAIGLLNYLFLGDSGFPAACAQAPQLTADEVMRLQQLLSVVSFVDIDDGQGGTQPALRFSGRAESRLD